MRVQVVTPWYPDYASVYLGVFVQQQVETLRRQGLSVGVEVPQLFPAPPGSIPESVTETIKLLAERDPDSVYPAADGVTWIPVPVPARSGYAGRAIEFASCISAKRSVLPVEADVTHAHLGVPTGAALLELGVRPLVVTEHQSTLDHVLREPRAREFYGNTLEAADAFLVVSAHLRDRLIREFGEDCAGGIEVMPNIVDLSEIAFAARPDYACSSWIYVGALVAHKGARLLVKAFGEYRERFDPGATLTVVGDGDLADWAVQYCAGRGLGSGLRLLGAVPHSQLADHLREADVMVHMSPAETFGIASLEGIGSGLPIVSLRNGGAEDNWGPIEQIAGVLLQPDASPTDVAEAVDELRRDPSRLDLAAARRFIESSFAPGAIAERLRSVYDRVLNQ